MIRPTGIHSQIYTDSHRYRHTNAQIYERTRTCSHTYTHTICMYAHALIQIKKHGLAHIYTQQLQQGGSHISPTLSKLEDSDGSRSPSNTHLRQISGTDSGLPNSGETVRPRKTGKPLKNQTTKNQVGVDLEHRRRNAAWLLLLKQSSLVLIGI